MSEGISVSLEALSVLHIRAQPGETGATGTATAETPELKIMLDCSKANQEMGTPVDVVLISQPDMDHMYGLVQLLSSAEERVQDDEECGEDANADTDAPPSNLPHCIMTGAAKQMATMAFYSTLLGATEVEHDFTTDDIDRAFGRVTGLRYREQKTLVASDKLTVSVIPFNSGRMVGGAIWRINVNGVHDIIYAVDYNHKKEMVLSGCSMMDLGLGVRPGLVITSAGSAASASSKASSSSLLQDMVLKTLRNDGNVLIPVDASGRVLEVLMTLNALWEDKRLTYPLLFVGPMVKATMEFARCQLEWMNEDLSKGLGYQKVDNPLDMRRVTLCSTEKEAMKILHRHKGPVVVLAVSESMDDGPSRNFFSRWAGNRRNAVIVLDPKPESLAAQVLGGVGGRGHSELKMTVSTRVPLQGKELEEFVRSKAEKSEKLAAQRAEEKAKVKRDNVKVIENKRDRETTKAAGHTDAMDVDGVSGEGDETECLIEGFELDSAAAYPMFPEEDEAERTLQADEYGDVVDLTKLDGDRILSQALASEAEAEREQVEEEEDVMLPTKIERKNVELRVEALVEEVEMDGRSDAKSVQTMLVNMAPRSCVIVRGDKAEKSKLAKGLLSDLEGTVSVFVPSDSDIINLDLGPARSCVISDEVFTSLSMHTVGDMELGWVDADVGADGVELVKRAGVPRSGDVFVGEVKLSNLKRALGKIGIASDFQNGGLYCVGSDGDAVFVKRNDTGSGSGGLIVEGQICDGYYAIRDVIYAQYNLL